MLVRDVPSEDLSRLVATQLRSLFLLEAPEDFERVHQVIPEALDRSQVCFAEVASKYYRRDDEVIFSPFHGAQYCTFLYQVSRVLWLRNPGASALADRVYALNRSLHAVDLFYEVELPDVFACDHPLGSVIGRARIASHFFFTQGCTVGNNRGVYPVIGSNVSLLAGATVLGNCTVGDNVVFAAHSYICDRDIPANAIVFGREPDVVVKVQSAADVAQRRAKRWHSPGS